MFVARQLQKMLKVKEEEFLILGILMLANDDIHQQMLQLVEQYQQADAEEETHKVKLQTLARELALSKYAFEEIQVEDLVKIFKKTWKNDIPYAHIQQTVITFKLDLLKCGMMESSYSKIELYLISIFQPF